MVELTELKTILARFTKDDLIPVVSKLFPDVVRELQNDISSSKRNNVISIHEKLVQMDIDKDFIAFKLDLQFVQKYSSRKKWHIFKLENVKEGFDDVNHFDPEFFKERLEENLSRSSYECKAYSEFYQEAIWTVVLLRPLASRKKGKRTKFFLIHYPHLPYMLHSYVIQSLQDLLKLALQLIFKCRKVKSLKLSSRNVATILQLALQKDGCKFNGGPMPHILQPQCIPVSDIIEVYSPNVVDEQNTLLLNKEYMKNLYGTFQQPPLESFTIQTDSSLNKSGDGTTAKCKIVVSGQNIIEGIRELVCQNIIEQPLQECLQRLPNMGRNQVHLTDK